MKLHLYKFKRPSIRTQIVVDMNKMIIFISGSENCCEPNDGLIFLRMNFKNKLHIGNCLAMDCVYPTFIYQFKENALNIRCRFNGLRFMYSAEKKKIVNQQ